MLWFDDNPKTSLDAKVRQAAEYYLKKYGHSPDLCLVNPRSLPGDFPPDQDQTCGQVLIRPLHTVLPGHLLIGVDDRLPAAAD
jgi:hypothetical protein